MTQKEEFMSGIRPGDVLIIERYAHIHEYGELIDTVRDPNTGVITGVTVRLLETGEEGTFSVFLVEPLAVNTLTLQKLGFDNIESETMYAVNGTFSLIIPANNDDGRRCCERIYVSTHSSPCCWTYREDDTFDRDDEHAVPVKFIYDIQHAFENHCGHPLSLADYYVRNGTYEQKKKDYDQFIKDQIIYVLNKNRLYAGDDLAARILRELSEQYED